MQVLRHGLFDVDLTDAVMTGSAIHGADWNRARLSGADLRGATISGLNLAVLSDYAGLRISESQQNAILNQLGVDVSPDQAARPDGTSPRP